MDTETETGALAMWITPPADHAGGTGFKMPPSGTFGIKSIQVWSGGHWVGTWPLGFTGGELWRLHSDDNMDEKPPEWMISAKEEVFRDKKKKDNR